jgi:hypothetical protein
MGGQITYYLLQAATYSAMLPLLILSLKINRQPPELWWLAAFLAFSFMCEMAGMISVMIGSNPNIVGNIYWLLSISLISTFFFHALRRQSLKGPLIFFNVAYAVFALSNILFVQKADLNTYSQIINALFILCFCIMFFYKLLSELPTQQLHRLPMFWIISAFFFSYAGKLVIYTVSHYMIHFERDDLIIIWSFHNFLTIVGNLIIAYGAWLNHKQLRSAYLSL